MQSLHWLKQAAAHRLEKLHLRLADPEAHLQLPLLGVLTGLVAGGVMVIFRLMIEAPQSVLFGADNLENYEQLTLWMRFLLPTAGGLLIGFIFHRLAAADRQVGIVHVMECLAYKESLMPIKNAGMQLLGAGLCIVAGHSVGREGPSIHIGAACGSWMGQRLRLPHSSIRVLVACGAAGAIAAAFNTPLAGVVFAMEVVLVEYILADFTPIILAAVSATAISRQVFAADPIFIVPETWLGSLGELFYIVLMGVLIGAISTLFERLLLYFSRCLTERPVWLRMTLAGIATGLLAMPVPQIMGIGYDTVNEALLGTLGLGLMLAVLMAKLLATAMGLGLGLPGGLIGPTLVMGAAAGGAIGVALETLAPGNTSSPAFYAMLGMGAMMGATLNAPLAALTALLELTANPHVILPGMLAIVAAGLTSQRILKTPSIFLKLMEQRGLNYRSDPVSQFLRRLVVSRSMEPKVIRLPRQVESKQLNTALTAQPRWLVIEDQDTARQIIPAEDLARWLEEQPELEGDACFDLWTLPVSKYPAMPISPRATLLGALRRMEQENVDALYVVPPRGERLLGVVTREAIEDSYRYPLGKPETS